MRFNWDIIKFILLFTLVIALYAFGWARNDKRHISKADISFYGEDNLFITNENVSKLLIQNRGAVKKLSKETLDLNALETALNSNPMIKSAEVYVAVNGTLSAEVKQRRPIARVNTNASYYIDDDGKFMPLSSNYTARVPMVTGYIQKNDLKTVYNVARKVEADNFLRQHVVEINQNANKKITLKLRQCKFNVYIGSLKALDKKINNLKAFYKKSLKEETLGDFTTVNLQFDNQVVCTKI